MAPIHISDNLARACRDAVTRSLATLQPHAGGRHEPAKLILPTSERIAISYDAGGGLAGQLITLPAKPGSWGRYYALRLNPMLLLSNTSEMLNDTIPHEVAHAVVRETWGRDAESHGWQWAMVMWLLGFANPGAQKYHSMDIAACKSHKLKGIVPTMTLEDL